MIRTTRTRRGVTLVEMLVAAALSISGMWLLTWVFQQGMDSFRMGNATANLTAQERMVTSLMTRDLKADKFLEEDNKPNRGRRLSDQRPDLPGYKAPKSGYFWTRSNSTAGYSFEGSDSYGFGTSRSSNHFISFTMILPGGRNDQTFGVEVPAYSGNQYFGTAAEVSYYLKLTGKTANGTTDVFDLYRAQKLVARTFDDAPAYDTPVRSDPNDPPEVMSIDTAVPQNARRLRTLSQLGNSLSRIQPYAPLAAGSNRSGEDKLLSNVLSFEVKYSGTDPLLKWPTTFDQGNTDFPYDFLPTTAGEFDTHGAPNGAPPTGAPNGTLLKIRITGAQIRIRAYDPQTRSTRQTTFTVDQ